ncbi:MAG TPA: glycosyltransferase family 87 protein [Gemmataceae bacterium]|nr:glycosyltransferase family 87 protein [Gemmataceae bacterium]
MDDIGIAVPAATRTRRSPYPLLLAVLLIVLAFPFLLRKPADWDDVFVPAAVRLRTGGDIYQHAFVFPPVNALLALPFSHLPRLGSLLAWYAVSAFCFCVLLRGSWRLAGGHAFPRAGGVPRREHLIVAVGLVLGLPFALDCFGNRHTDLLIAALVITGCLSLRAGRGFVAAIWFGLAGGLKCTPLLWAPYLLLKRRFGAAAVVLIVAIGVNVLPDLLYPAATGSRLTQWVNVFIAPMANGQRDPGVWGSAAINNHSLAGVAYRWLTLERTWDDGRTAAHSSSARVSPQSLRALVYGADAVLLLAAATVTLRSASRRRNPQPMGATNPVPAEALEFALVCLLMLLLSPQSSKPHFCTMMLPGFCLAREAVRRRDVVLGLVLAAAGICTLLANKDLWVVVVYETALWYSTVFAAALLLFAGCLRARWHVGTSRNVAAAQVAGAIRPSQGLDAVA